MAQPSYPGSEIPPMAIVVDPVCHGCTANHPSHCEKCVVTNGRCRAYDIGPWIGVAIVMVTLMTLLALSGVARGADIRLDLTKYGTPDQTGILHGRYLIGFDGRTRCPRWVLERLDSQQVKASIEREGGFRSDSLIPPEFRVGAADYAGSGFDIGHMAPFNTHRTSDDDGASTFVFSNAAPQVPEFNRGLWRTLEAELHDLAETQRLWVMTCPLWIPQGGKLSVGTIGKNGVWIPSHCGKAVLIEGAKGVRLQAWILPNKELKGRDTKEFVVSTNEFETAAGLDLWTELPDDTEARLEAVR